MKSGKQLSSDHSYNNSIWIKAIELTIIALIVLVPVAFYPYCKNVFLPIKELIAEVLILTSLMFWGFKIIDRGKIKFISTPLNLPVLAFISICLLSLFWSNNFFISMKELPLFLFGPLLYFLIVNNLNNKYQINYILSILIIMGSLSGMYGIFQYQGIDFSFWTHNVGRMRVAGLFGNVNYFAGYLIIPLSLAIALFFTIKNKPKKIFLLIGILVMGGSLIFTFTRGSYLALGVSVIFMAFLFLKTRGKNFIRENKNIFIIILIAIIMIAFLFVVPTPLSKSGTTISKIKERTSLARLNNEFSSGRRIAIWKFTEMMIKDHPILGSGIGTFKYNSLRYQAKFFDQGQNRTLYPHGFADKSHNEYLQLWAELGIIGLGVFIWLMIIYFNYGVTLLKKEKDYYRRGIIIGLMGSTVAVLVDGIFGFPLHLPVTVLLLWMVLGLIGVVGKTEEEREKLNQTIKNYKGEKIIKEKKKEIERINKNNDNKQSNIFRFKPLLYIGVILITVFLSVTVARPFMAKVYWYYAYKEIENKNWNEAIKIEEKALRWDPYFGQSYYYIGKILRIKELYGISLEYFIKATKYIDLPDLPQELAFLYLTKGQWDKAVVKLEEAISYQNDEKSMVPLYTELGNTYHRLEKYKKAEIAFKNALKIEQDFINAHYGLAGVYLKQKKEDEALLELQIVVELAPDSEEAKYAREIMQKIIQKRLKDIDDN